VGDRLRLLGHELALALSKFLRLLRTRELLTELHGVREHLFRQRGVVRAHGAQLILNILCHLPTHAQETLERLFSLSEIFLGELPRPGDAERGRLHRALTALLNKFCRISCHSLLPLAWPGRPLVSFVKSDLRHTFSLQRLHRRLVPET